jgi:hypothetical protein
MKAMPLSAHDIREVSARLRGIAESSGGRYDGWAASRRREG